MLFCGGKRSLKIEYTYGNYLEETLIFPARPKGRNQT